MIVTKQKEWDTILGLVEKKKNIFVIGCGECATTCNTGGERQVEEIKQKLKDAGKHITGSSIPQATCVSSQIKILMAKNRSSLLKSDAVLVFSCGSGTQAFKENDRLDLSVYSGNDTLFAATIDSKGDFNEVCSGCGDCILEMTEGLCPITRCPKGILNGPCGGHQDGKCEVDKTKECVWILIYKLKEKRNKINDLNVFKGPRDHKKALRPHNLKLMQP